MDIRKILTYLISSVLFYSCDTKTDRVAVKELSINSTVSIRYAKVHVRSVVENFDSKDQEVGFQVRIPREAFITNFSIVTNEKTITASIKEKEEANKVYNEAKASDVTAGIVTQKTNLEDDIDRDIFSVKVNVKAESTVEFRLEYEELLQKRAGVYSQKIFVDSDYLIPKLEVVCEFKEKQKFKQLTYQTPLDEEKLTYNEERVTEDGYYIRRIVWKPSESDQQNRAGLENPFEIEYELEPPDDGGIVFINDNGEFVHMFSTPCDETKIMMKQVVFVIDISGSMKGTPVAQVRQTMKTILDDLRSGDYFNIVLFNGKSSIWETELQQATGYNIAAAKSYIESQVIADGSTNIHDALLRALRLFKKGSEVEESGQFGQLVVFLTDGEPTEGVREPRDILAAVRKQNYDNDGKSCKSSIYTIAFGSNADIDFLSLLASENEGTITIVRESKSEDGEFLRLYRGIENPYYKDVKFTFLVDNEEVPEENVTRSRFRQYDCGNELVVGGWTYQKVDIEPVVTATGMQDGITFDNVLKVRSRNVDAETLSRLVYYEMVKDLLEEAKVKEETDPERSEEATNLALLLSLKYGFVTPLTSLVVTDFSPKQVAPKTKLGKGAVGKGAVATKRGGLSSNSNLPSLRDYDDALQYADDELWIEYNDLVTPESQNGGANRAGMVLTNVAVITSLLIKVAIDFVI